MKIITKISLLLIAALFQFTSISAYDFEVDKLQYTITTDSTVTLTGNDYSCLHDGALYDIVIPSHVKHYDVNYTVTAIGDRAFFETYNLIYCITIPETVKSIGVDALSSSNYINIICLAATPPSMNNSFCGEEINLFVLTDAYPLYKEFNEQNHIFSSIHITNGERSEPPIYEFIYLDYPDYFGIPHTLPYGCVVKFFSNDNSTIYCRGIEEDYMGYSDCPPGVGGSHEGFWGEWYHTDYYYYENSSYTRRYGFFIQAYAIEDGKSPSYPVFDGDDHEFGFDPKVEMEMSFDFKESGIAYSIHSNGIEVTYCLYCVHGYPFTSYDVEGSIGIPFSYFGDVVIPSYATNHVYKEHYDIITSYPVVSIGKGAFSHAYYDEYDLELIDTEYDIHTLEDLTSVTLPGSITAVGEYAFGDCPNLSFIKCKGAIPPSAYDNSFDDGVYQNTTLYVPMDAVDAYRNATGWKNFANIVGHYDFDYDFEVDGLYYAIVGDNVVVTNGNEAYQGVVNIPASLTYEGTTYSVTGISSSAFADATLQSLIIPVTIGTIGEGAFTNCHIGSLVITGNGAWTAGAIGCDVDGLYVMSGVTGIQGLLVNPATTVYAYATVPPACDSQSFSSYDAALHVPASALAAYFTAPYWNYFINITSDAVEPKNITLNNDSIEVLVGNQLMLAATPAPANATPGDIIWTSSDDAVATVEGGVITAVHVGECDIKAYLLDKIAVCHVTVTEIAPTGISVSPEFAKLEIGSQLTLTATVLPEEATDKAVTWTTSNSAVAMVDNMGTVTAVGQGECFITATCRDNQAICHVIVVDHFIYITLDQHEVRLMPNHMVTLTPSVMPEGTPLVVTSTNPNVAAARMANGNIQIVGIQEGRTLIKVNSTDGYAEADSCLVKVYTLRGDVNCDGFVNINDVTSLINYLLSHNADGIDVINADANNDGNVNIADVTRLINHLLSGDELDPKEEPDENTLTFTVNGVTFTMVAVEGGTFTMGATPEQVDDALDWEYPTHQVTLSNYAIGQTEVTQALWEAVTGTNPSRFQGRPNNPVELVDWNDCQAFITQLNALTGKQFRLPTEAEWEFAARGGNNSQHYKYAGSNDFDEVGWHSGNTSSTQPVGSKKANELGIYDMSGNVWEWCQDYFGDYSSEAQTNPTGPETGTDRIRRGVGWNGSISSGRVSHRSSREATYKYNSQGLRLAL